MSRKVNHLALCWICDTSEDRQGEREPFFLFLRSVAWVWMPGESSVWFLLRLYKKWSPLRIIVLFLNQTIKCISQHWCVTYVWLVYLVFNFVWLGLVWEASIFSTFHAPNQNQHPCQPIQFLHIFPNPTDLYYMQTLFNLALASLKKLLLTVDPKSTSLSYIRCLVVVGFLVWKNDRFHKMVQIEKKRGGGYHADSKFNLDNTHDTR